MASGNPGCSGGPGAAVWLPIGATVAGAVVGAAVSRFSAGPWDGLALAALVLGLLLLASPVRRAFPGLEPILRFGVAFAIGFVLAVALTALATQMSWRGIGVPGEVATLAGLGFVAALLATAILFRAALVAPQRASVGLGPVLMIGLVAVAVFGLYGRGRADPALRGPIEAEARREAT